MERGTNKWVVAAVAVLVLALAAIVAGWATGAISLPGRATPAPATEVSLVDTATPRTTPTGTPRPATATATPPLPTRAPATETATPLPATPRATARTPAAVPPTAGPAGDLDVGVHGWNYILDTMVEHPQDNAMISLLIPSMMYAEGYEYADMVAAAGYAGPSDAKLGPLSTVARNHAGRGANVLIYVPEAVKTAGNVPIEETLYLEEYLPQFVDVAVENGYIPAYGPGLSLVSEPETWRYGAHYDLQVERVTKLASMMPDNAFWILRMNTPEQMYRNDMLAFGEAVAEYAAVVHAGNPTLRIVLHLSCRPGDEDAFLAYIDAARPYVDQVYAGIDYPFPSDPNYDPLGTTATMLQILERTGAGPAGPELPTGTPLGPTETPGPPPVTSNAAAWSDLPYGPDPAHRVDVYLPTNGKPPYPVVAWFHGGGFEDPSDKRMVRQQCGALAAAGFACVAANYRRHTDGAAEFYLPAQLFDAKAVIRWIRANAGAYGLDPERVGAIGGSAGAFLSTALGTSGDVSEAEGDVGPHLDQPSHVQACVGLAGVYDVLAFYRRPIDTCAHLPAADARCLETELFNCYFNDPDCLDRMRLSSSYHHISAGDADSLLVIGDRDATPNGLPDHQAFHDALLAAGVDSTLHILPGYGHGEMLPDIHPLIIDWFTAHLTGEP